MLLWRGELKAVSRVIVDHADRLHISVTNRGADEAKTGFF